MQDAVLDGSAVRDQSANELPAERQMANFMLRS